MSANDMQPSVNERAFALVQRMMDDADALGLAVSRLPNGATVVDSGVYVTGSLEAGRLFAEACLGGLGQVALCQVDIGELRLPGVSVSVSHPPVACLAAQYAGWAVEADDYVAMGSGPARALYRADPVFEHLTYEDGADVAVLMLEAHQLPTEAAARKVAEKCGVAPEDLCLLVAPTASLVGSVQVAARVVETGLHKMVEVDFDVETVLSGFGTCPLASIAADDLHAIGRTNDAVLYGGRAWYTVRTEDERVEAVIDKIPSSASHDDYGTPFYELFQRYGGDFYQIEPLLFGPAEVYINNVTSGRTFHAGAVNAAMIRRVLLA
jgi:methenyltetrahydromethanopterin cyclohydrolase